MKYTYYFVGTYKMYADNRSAADTLINEYIAGLNTKDIRIVDSLANPYGTTVHYALEGSMDIEALSPEDANTAFKDRTKELRLLITHRNPLRDL